MSRNELFLLLACAIAVSVLSGPSPLARSSSLTVASLIAPAPLDGTGGDPSMFQRSFDHQ